MKKEQSDFVPLSEQTRAAILGSLLGDGSLKIHPGYANARFSFRHSSKQREYLLWKVGLLQKELASEACAFEQSPDGFSRNNMLRFQSRALPSLTELYRLTHKGKSFVVRRKWLNQLTPLSLAIWWCDDGSIISNGRKGVFCSEGFTVDDQVLIRNYLKKVWDIDVRLGQTGSRRKETGEGFMRLWFRSTEELKKFLRIILPHIPPCMLYKVLLLYRDIEFQQRWITEVATATGIPQKEVEAAVQQRKQRWKRFSK